MYLVGKVLRPRGLDGELKVKAITSFPEHFSELESVLVKQNGQQLVYHITQSRYTHKFVYLKFESIHSVEQADALRGAELYIEQEQLTNLEQGTYYIHDLLGLKVFDEQNNYLGELTDVESYTSNDVYVIKGEDGGTQLIPAIQQVIKNVDIPNGRITIHVMEGLLD